MSNQIISQCRYNRNVVPLKIRLRHKS
jgi:hypothetical protein